MTEKLLLFLEKLAPPAMPGGWLSPPDTFFK
jgi:hypothetical protein